MAELNIERIGGLAGMGGTNARLRSRGRIDTSALSAEDQRTVDALFKRTFSKKPDNVADGFRFELRRSTKAGVETIVVPESAMPATLAACVKDEFV